jgi:carboxymethylenebutenolidase
MRTALRTAGNASRSEIIVYPGAGHGFHADYRESYNAEAAADGWARCLAWFREHGVA